MNTIKISAQTILVNKTEMTTTVYQILNDASKRTNILGCLVRSQAIKLEVLPEASAVVTQAHLVLFRRWLVGEGWQVRDRRQFWTKERTRVLGLGGVLMVLALAWGFQQFYGGGATRSVPPPNVGHVVGQQGSISWRLLKIVLSGPLLFDQVIIEPNQVSIEGFLRHQDQAELPNWLNQLAQCCPTWNWAVTPLGSTQEFDQIRISVGAPGHDYKPTKGMWSGIWVPVQVESGLTTLEHRLETQPKAIQSIQIHTTPGGVHYEIQF